MIVDTSALLAVLFAEDDAARIIEALYSASDVRVSAASYFESAILIDRDRDPIASRRLDEFLEESQVVIEPVTHEQARIAREAYADFGRGSGHPAKLNFGDCFAYALAKFRNEPLLFKGGNFKFTDVRFVEY